MDSSSGIQHADFARVSPAGKSNLTPIPSRRKLILVAPWCTAADCEVLGRLHGQCAQGMSLGVSPSAALLYCTAMHAENRNCSSCKGKALSLMVSAAISFVPRVTLTKSGRAANAIGLRGTDSSDAPPARRATPTKASVISTIRTASVEVVSSLESLTRASLVFSRSRLAGTDSAFLRPRGTYSEAVGEQSLQKLKRGNTTMARHKMRPVSPGEVLREQLDELGMSANTLAAALHVPTNRVTGILNATRALTPETALRLERYFTGTTAQFWLNLQMGFDLRRAEISEAKALREIRPLKAS